jgi:hypothetical protein
MTDRRRLDDLLNLSFYPDSIPVDLRLIARDDRLKRTPQLPNVPTMNDAGVPVFQLNVWHGLFVHTDGTGVAPAQRPEFKR